MNIANCIVEHSRTRPKQMALAAVRSDSPDGSDFEQLDFAGLNSRCDRFASGLAAAGLRPGMKTLLMVRPGIDFIALVFALFKVGAVPILIDPGMGLRGFLNCVSDVAPEAMLGIPKAHLLRRLFPSKFKSLRLPFCLGAKSWFSGCPATDEMPEVSEDFPVFDAEPDQLAAILFTSGSTGPAKGVEYTHRIFCTQVDILREEFLLGPDDVDLPCFPLFALFSTGLGAGAVIPRVDPTRPANVLPENILGPAEKFGCTYSFGSPALWETVSRYCEKNNRKLTSLKRVYMSGAPVSPALHRRMLNFVLPDDGDVFAPYGATESLPVACFNGRQVLYETAARTVKGEGVCVGRPVKKVNVRIIKITDDAIPNWLPELELAPGEKGEITVTGPVVTPRYHNREKQTALAKIYDGDTIIHRIGDIGYLDEQGRLWFCGRKAHRVETAEGTLFSVCVEAIFNEHPHVYRSALVGVGEKGSQKPVIIIEPESEFFPKNAKMRKNFTQLLLSFVAKSPLTSSIKTVLFYKSFPVDIRHNAKINREKLQDWAAKQLN